MPAKKPYGNTPIDSVKHRDKRANIPTEELRGFVADNEKKPKIIRYQRDESLDPQLVWQGKDEQDSQDLEVPAVPISRCSSFWRWLSVAIQSVRTN